MVLVVILVWYWYSIGFRVVLVWHWRGNWDGMGMLLLRYWYGIGMALVRY